MSKTMPVFILCMVGAFAAPTAISRLAHAVAEIPDRDRSACVIKGNVSINTGERIYHVPGQKFYTPTKISRWYGERWFCSEAEARAAGWRKSRR